MRVRRINRLRPGKQLESGRWTRMSARAGKRQADDVSNESGQPPVVVRVIKTVGGDWKAVARSLALLIPVGVGVWLLPVDFKVGPVEVSHHSQCQVPPIIQIPAPAPVPSSAPVASPVGISGTAGSVKAL